GALRRGLFSLERVKIDGEACALISEIDITQQWRSERIKEAVYKISEAANSAKDLQELFAEVHRIVGELMYAKNFYVALNDPATDMLRMPYFVDAFDVAPPERKFGNGATEYVIRTGKPLYATAATIHELH